ncbi:hypothetical protein [Ruminococcus sp.]|uniref:hypothetical protein n=1 Tax=Ruminococcus sp. TaxID=41978 RepID=UPI0025F8C661|nr:hypothetical protein [Ruminococcus sp.]MBR1430372.1 hypothetical protein [Ruminococcus sp.]
MMCQYNGLNEAGLIYCEFIIKTAVSAIKQGDERQFPRVLAAELKTTLLSFNLSCRQAPEAVGPMHGKSPLFSEKSLHFRQNDVIII